MTTTTNIAQRILDENGFSVDTSTINITAQNILDENNWNVDDDITVANMEILMDNAINHINLEANTIIAPMSGASGSKTATLSRSESLAVKLLSALLVRAYKEKGPNVGISSISVSNIINDAHFTLFTDMVNKAIIKLKTTNIIFVEHLVSNAIAIVNLYGETTISGLSGTAGSKSLTATDNETLIVKLVASNLLDNHMKQKLGNFKITAAMEKLFEKLRVETSELPFLVGEDTSGID